MKDKKDGFIKICGTDNIFYDSVDRVYRYRMYCPNCGKYSGCRCVQHLDDAINICESGISVTCSNKCCLVEVAKISGWDDIISTMCGEGMGWKWKLKAFVLQISLCLNKCWISERDCIKYFDEVDYDYDDIEGEFC